MAVKVNSLDQDRATRVPGARVQNDAGLSERPADCRPRLSDRPESFADADRTIEPARQCNPLRAGRQAA
jgi:hypothetical protein